MVFNFKLYLLQIKMNARHHFLELFYFCPETQRLFIYCHKRPKKMQQILKKIKKPEHVCLLA